ncbi:MAG TPA: ABC transporter permease [Anaerolineae bacterium]|nr:ABC transporter permease [Anaerolineae bacterium]
MSESTVKSSVTANGAVGLFRTFLARTGPLIVLIVLAVLLLAASPAFQKPSSWMLLGLEAAAIGLVAAGQTFVILTGGIDLSVEAMVSFSGVLAAILIAGTSKAGGQIAFGVPAAVAIGLALLAGLIIGLFQGVLITKFKMNPFIVTLGFRSMLLGVSLVWTRGAGININKDGFLSFLTDSITITPDLKVPMPLILVLIAYVIVWFVLKNTKMGRYTYALGGNETAARLSGINVDRTKMIIYGISGFLAAIAGVLVMGRLQSGAYQNGTNMTLISVAAVVIGGTSLAGGKGGIWGTLIGVFIIKIVEAGLVYMDVPSNAKEIVIGAIIILAVMLDVVRSGEITWLRRRPKTS